MHYKSTFLYRLASVTWQKYLKWQSNRTNRIRIRKSASSSPLNIVIGAGGFFQEGWVPTDIEYLDATNIKHWHSCFKPNTIDHILAEHVWEHMTIEDGITAATNCFTFLKNNGTLRIAVPDGYFPNPDYIEQVKPNGSGPGAKDHKVIYTYRQLHDILQRVGFDVKLLEYFSEDGRFHGINWSADGGFIHRSARNDKRNQDGQLNYTSLILDAIKRGRV